jgi:hypothetical protein
MEHEYVCKDAEKEYNDAYHWRFEVATLKNQTMKTSCRSVPFIAVILSLMCFAGWNLACAQDTAAPDSIVQLAAQSEGLSLVSAADVPEEGTFWLVMSNGIVPDPAPLFDPSLPIYAITTNGQYLVDATDGQVALDTGQTVEDALADLAADVTNLIGQIQNPPVSRSLTMHAMDEGGFTPDFSFDTNGLYLQINTVSNGLASLNLFNGTDTVYAIWGTTNLALPMTEWQVETELWPTNDTTNTLPFTVDAGDNANLFLRAQDWTGVTANGNETPLWWLYYWFGTDGLSLSDGTLDSQGNTLLYDYENGVDPNPIQFSLQFTNDYFNANPAYGTIAVSSGAPFYEAILINDTNLADAVWQPYTSTNASVTFGTNGIYNVYVGLRGLPTNALQTWTGTQLTYDTVPPTLAVTNPTDGAVCVPTIQLQGYANETLGSLTFDVSNAAGIFTNQTGCLTGQFYDTNLIQFTTNYFQCYDVALTNGVNQITLHATDLAGNTTISNFSYTLSYDGVTNPPALTLIWPQNDALVSGSSFTIQAQVGDATAGIMATITDTNGDTNIVPALVERNGAVWVENLPLNGGTNTVTLTATNAAGLVNTTNFNVVQSGVSLSINPISDDQLNQSSVSVTGTVGDESENITVNGVAAYYVDDSGDWEADDVPVNPAGTASFTVEAGLNLDNPLAGETLVLEQPSVVQVISQHSNYQDVYTVHNFCDGTDFISISTEILDWTMGVGGESSWYTTNFWSGETTGSETDLSAANPPAPPWLYATTRQPYYQYVPNGESETCDGPQDDLEITTQTAKTMIELAAGGPAQSGVAELVRLTVQVNSGDAPFPVSAAKILGQAPVASATNAEAGELYVSVPAGATENITPVAPGADNYTFNVQATNVTFHIYDANNGTDLTLQTNTVIVGQQMNLYCQLSLTNETLTNFQWTIPGDAISNFVADDSSGIVYTNFSMTSSNINFYWVDGATNRTIQCSAMVNGQTIKAQATFNVLEPTGKITTITGTVALDTNYVVGINTNGSPIYELALHYGNPAAIPGITFSNMIVMPSGNYNYGSTGYTNEWVQMVTSTLRTLLTDSGTNVWYKLQATNVLDTTYPYPNDPGVDTSSDSPGQGVNFSTEAVSVSDNFNRWLMFKPNGGQWVPLRVVTWSWGGSGTNIAGSWTLTSSNNAVNPTDTGTTNYPQWTGNITNFTFQPE